MCNSQQDMSNWITALIMARELCNQVGNVKADCTEQSKDISNQPRGEVSKNNAPVNNLLILRPEALFQEAVYQQALDSIWHSASEVIEVFDFGYCCN